MTTREAIKYLNDQYAWLRDKFLNGTATDEDRIRARSVCAMCDTLRLVEDCDV